jgi:DNA-directed RNA polymerase I, II, and III subunit RPABC2
MEYEDDDGQIDDINLDIEEVEADIVLEELESSQREVGKESRALQFLTTHHPECRLDYREDILQRMHLSKYPPDSGSDIKHKSVPYLTLFEKTKIIGFRANQIAKGSKSYIHVPPHITDVIEIARLELDQGRLPYILKRPMPDGTFEYIRLVDLIVV